MAQHFDAYPYTSGPSSASRERLAWAILLTAFAIFCLLAVGIPLTIRWYIHNATRPQLATLTGTLGTTLVIAPSVPSPFAVAEGVRRPDVREGNRIETDAASSAVVRLFDESSITVFPNSELTIERMRSPRFRRSPLPNEIVLRVARGTVRVNVAPPGTRPLRLIVHTPHATVRLLEEGSYSLEVANNMTQVSVRAGKAEVTGAVGPTILLPAGRRSQIPLGEEASAPLPVAQNLIVNGDFRTAISAAPITQGPLAEGWVVYNDQGGDGGTVDGTAEIVVDEGRRAVRFYRTGSQNNHGETGIRQALNKYIGDYETLKLRLDVKLKYQSLSGGGQLNSEFPLMVRINYKDVYGNDNHWVRGFYYQNDAGFFVNETGQRIPRDTWFPVEIPDLKAQLRDPLIIMSVQIYASGWDYESLVSEVGLIAE